MTCSLWIIFLILELIPFFAKWRSNTKDNLTLTRHLLWTVFLRHSSPKTNIGFTRSAASEINLEGKDCSFYTSMGQLSSKEGSSDPTCCIFDKETPVSLPFPSATLKSNFHHFFGTNVGALAVHFRTQDFRDVFKSPLYSLHIPATKTHDTWDEDPWQRYRLYKLQLLHTEKLSSLRLG